MFSSFSFHQENNAFWIAQLAALRVSPYARYSTHQPTIHPTENNWIIIFLSESHANRGRTCCSYCWRWCMVGGWGCEWVQCLSAAWWLDDNCTRNELCGLIEAIMRLRYVLLVGYIHTRVRYKTSNCLSKWEESASCILRGRRCAQYAVLAMQFGSPQFAPPFLNFIFIFTWDFAPKFSLSLINEHN